MTEQPDILALFLRPDCDGDVSVEAVMTAQEVAERSAYTLLRMRFNPDIQCGWVRAPAGTTPGQFANAIEALSAEERWKFYRRFAGGKGAQQTEENETCTPD